MEKWKQIRREDIRRENLNKKWAGKVEGLLRTIVRSDCEGRVRGLEERRLSKEGGVEEIYASEGEGEYISFRFALTMLVSLVVTFGILVS